MDELDSLKIALYVLANGGQIDRKSFYDEEGVEGWMWFYDDRVWTELGSWDCLPTIPEDLIAYVKASTDAWRN